MRGMKAFRMNAVVFACEFWEGLLKCSDLLVVFDLDGGV